MAERGSGDVPFFPGEKVWWGPLTGDSVPWCGGHAARRRSR